MTTEDGTVDAERRHEKTGGTVAFGVVTGQARAEARRRNVLGTEFDDIYEQYRHRVYSWCLRIARNMEDAEELTDRFLLLFRKINTYRGGWAFSTWLYRLATNIALMRLRRKTPPQTSLDEILETHEGAINPRQELKASDRALAASIARVDLERMFDQMPGGFRKAFFLHDSEDYSHPEIAELTGWSIGTRSRNCTRRGGDSENCWNASGGGQAAHRGAAASAREKIQDGAGNHRRAEARGFEI